MREYGIVWHICAVHVSEKRCNQKGCQNRIQSCNKTAVEAKGQVKRGRKKEVVLPLGFDPGTEHSQVQHSIALTRCDLCFVLAYISCL